MRKGYYNHTTVGTIPSQLSFLPYFRKYERFLTKGQSGLPPASVFLQSLPSDETG